MASSWNYTWTGWQMSYQGVPQTTYNSTAIISVERESSSSSRIKITADASMVAPAGDEWPWALYLYFPNGELETQRILIPLNQYGIHAGGTTYTGSASYFVDVGYTSTSITCNARFAVCKKTSPYDPLDGGGYSGYSTLQTFSLTYPASATASTITNVSVTNTTFGSNFTVTVDRKSSSFRETVLIKYGSSYSSSYVLSEKTAETTKTVNIPLSFGQNKNASTISFKVALVTYNGSTQVGSEYVDSTVRTVTFSGTQKTTLSNWTNLYFGNSSTVSLTRNVSYLTDTVQVMWENSTPATSTVQTKGTSASLSYSIPYNACPSNALTKRAKIRIISYNGSAEVATTDSSWYTINVKSGDNYYKPSIGTVITNIHNDLIPALGTQGVVGSSTVYAQLTIGNVTTREPATITATKIEFPDGKTKTGGNATISETSNTINSSTYTTTFTVTDSRGYTVSKTQSVSALVVANPSFTSLDVFRANSQGVRDDTGTYIYATAVPSYQAKIGEVTNTCTMQMSVNGGQAVTVNANTLTRIYSGADTTQTYTVSASVSDLVHTTTTTRTVGAESVSFNIQDGGRGIGIGKYSTHKDSIDLAYDIYTDANIIHKNYQNIVNAGSSASIDNGGKGLTTYYICYCALDSNDNVVSGSSHAGMIVMFEGEEIQKDGFVGLTTSITGTTFSFGLSSGNYRLKYRVFENSLGSYT